MTTQILLKIPFVGDGGVGKTSIISRLMGETFSQSYLMTLGANFFVKKMNIDQIDVGVQLWDTAGQQRFTSLRPMFYRGSRAVVLVYDITRPETFENLQHWLNDIQREAPGSTISILGNKIDLEDQRLVSTGEGRNYATTVGALFAETSAKTGQGIEEALHQLVQTVCAKLEPRMEMKPEKALKTTVHPQLLMDDEILLFELREVRR